MSKRHVHAAPAPDLKRRAERIKDFLDQIDDLKADLKLEKKSAEGASYKIKAVLQCVKEIRKGEDYCDCQLQLELALDDYREKLGLETRASHRVRTAAERLTEHSEVTADDDGVVDIRPKGRLQ